MGTEQVALTELIALLTNWFGGFGLLLLGVFAIGKWLLPRFEATQKALTESYENQMNQATEERKRMTEQFIMAMSTCVSQNTKAMTENTEVLKELSEQNQKTTAMVQRLLQMRLVAAPDAERVHAGGSE